MTGVRASATHIGSQIGGSSDSLGVAFAGGVETFGLDGTTHGSLDWILGGGEAGFEGALAGTLDVGYRIDVTDRQGPFGRAGFNGRMQGNDKYYFSMLELPRLTVGWQYLDGQTLFEIGAHGGPVITGRYNPGDEGYRRTSGSLEYGAYGAIQVGIIRINGDVMRIDAKNTGTGRPVDVARGSLCGLAGKVGICADLMAIRGDADMGQAGGGVQTVTTGYAGLTLGVASW